MSGKKIVLVPTDFAEASLAALDYAVFIANRTNSFIHLIHIVERNKVRDKAGLKTEYKNKLTEIDATLNNIKNSSGAAFRITTHIITKKDSVYDTIIDYGNKKTVELCCMGTYGAAAHASGLHVGDNTERLVKMAEFPVLTCYTAKYPVQLKNLLLPIDLTRNTNEKVQRIIQFAKNFDSVIHLVAVSEFIEELMQSKEKLEERLDEAAKEIRANGLKCTTEIILHDYVSKSVVEYAAEIDADLLVIMSQKENRIIQLLLGSRINKVIANAEIPVLSFRPVDAD